MEKPELIIFLLCYIIFAFIFFFGMWKEIERDDIYFDRIPRVVRIGVRIFVLCVWPLLFLLAVCGLAWKIIENFVKAFIE